VTDSGAADLALKSAMDEQSEIDGLLVKLSTSGLGFSIALGAFETSAETNWLTASWFVLLLSVICVLASKYISAAANRSYYLSQKHTDKEKRSTERSKATRLNFWIRTANYSAGASFVAGAGLLVAHVLAAS